MKTQSLCAVVWTLLSLIWGVGMPNVEAKIVVEKISYAEGNEKFEGLVAYNVNLKKKAPGVLVIHNWMGVSAETESKIKAIAALGYVAFAGDIYGAGIRPKDSKEAGELATKYKNDRSLLRKRAEYALNALKNHNKTDTSKLFAIGYCFGGTTALELGRAGLDLKGIISFHGGLSNPTPDDAKNFKGEVLVYHGGIDPFVPESEVAQFKKEMDNAKINYQFVSFANTVHSFTEKAAGNDLTKGAAYNEWADRRSFEGMKDFFQELSKN